MSEKVQSMVPESDFSGVDVESISPVRRAVEVVAPVDMPGGFRFNVNVGDCVLPAEVPEGGVVQGQRFAAWVLDDGSDQQNVALRWRDGFFDCFRFGVCHPMFCLTLWCAPCALGQVMTRAKLDIIGNPRNSNEETFWTPFKFLFALTMTYIVIRGSTQTVLNNKLDDDENTDTTENDEEDDEYPTWAESVILFRFLVFLSFAIFTIVLITKTRRFIRGKDHVPAETCGKLEDCCMALLCPWCTICQMARHTADYDNYGARCCTDTGLAADAPLYD